jgi:hypothetical protein
MKKKVIMLGAAVAIFALIATIGSAAAAHYIWVDSDVKGVGYKNSEYEVDTVPGIATGIEMKELEAGSGLVTAQKWTFEVNGEFDRVEGSKCDHGLEETKIFDVEYFPITYQNHSYDSKWQEKKCVKNYDIGAVTDANFVQCEKLQKEETLVTYGKKVTYGGDEGGVDQFGGGFVIVQTVTADVLGISHIGFAAKNLNDHHHTIAIGKEETVGNFHIEKTIDIRADCQEGEFGDWLGCP